MAATDLEKKALILSKWAEYKTRAHKAGMKPVQAQFVKESKGSDWETNISTLRNYLDLNPSRPAKDSYLYDSSIPAPMGPIPSSPEAIKEQMQRLQEAYKISLQNKVSQLESDIDNLKTQLNQAKADLAACVGKTKDSGL